MRFLRSAAPIGRKSLILQSDAVMRRMRGHWILFATALLCSGSSIGALAARVLNTESGLPHDRVNSLVLDSKGSLWICTDDGLARFDGHRLVSYGTASGLPHIHVNAMLETTRGEFWIATDGGLSRFDPRPGARRFTNYAPGGPHEAGFINALLEEPGGDLLAGTALGVLRLRGTGDARVFERILHRGPGDPSAANKVNALAYDARGRLWLATEHGLYRRGAGGAWQRYGHEHGLPDLFVRSFARDREGATWVGFRGGFGRLALEPAARGPVLDRIWTDRTGALGQEVRAIWFASDSRRWIGTDVGLREWLVDASGASRFRDEPIQRGMASQAVNAIAEDAAGNLWIGTRRNGLLRVEQSPFRNFGVTDGLHLGRDQTVLETKAGRIAVFDVGDRRSRLYTQAGDRFVGTLPALPRSAAGVPHWLHTAAQDHRGAWWFSTERGLFRFPALESPFDLNLLPDRHVDRFFEDAAGDLWISNWGYDGAHVHRWQRSSRQIVDESHRLPAAARAVGISAFAQDRGGAMWIGLQRPGGVLRLRDGRFQPVARGLRGHIAQLFLDSQERLWIATTETGLGLIANPTATQPALRRYTRRDGLSSDEVWCVTEDSLGRIYTGTSHGVDRVDPASARVIHYTSAQGLIRGDIRSALRDRTGNLWFASANGLARLTPRADRTIRPSQARITGLRAAGVAVPLSEFGETEIGPMRLRANQNSLQVDFTATDFQELPPIRFQFRLTRDGRAAQDDAWQDAGNSSTVHLINQAPGPYTFFVRPVMTNGQHGEPATFTFSIMTPFWRTWWFPLACGIGVAAVGFFVHAQRLRSQLGIERVRSRIAMDLHDDIGSSLSRVSLLSEALKSRLHVSDAPAQRMLDDIAESSRGLVRDMSDIVWSLDPRRDRIGDLATRLRAFGSDLLETHGVEWAVESPLEEAQRNLPVDVRRELFLVFKEGIHNVAKHAQATKAALRLQLHDGEVWGELVDDGRGIGPGRPSGTGLVSMRARVTQLAGSIEIASAPGHGTRIHVVVRLPGRS